MRRSFAVGTCALAVLIGAAACGDTASDNDKDNVNDAAATIEPNTVVLKGTKFVPGTVNVKAGESVTWLWRDGSVMHNVKGDGFESELTAKGEFKHTFAEAGTFPYVCTVHPTMKGEVIAS